MANIQNFTILGLLPFLKNLIDFLYIIGYCPFRLKSHTDKKIVTLPKLKKEGWWVQNIFCLVTAMIATMYCIKDLRFTTIKISQNPDHYFRIIFKITVLASVVHFKFFRTGSENFVKLANFVINSNKNNLPIPDPKHVVGPVVFFIVLSVMFVANGILTLFAGNYTSYSEPLNISWWSRMASEGHGILFITAEDATPNHGMSVWEQTIFGIIGFGGIFYRYA